MEKPFYRKWWFAAIMAILVIFMLGAIGSIFGGSEPKENLADEKIDENEKQADTGDEEEKQEKTENLEEKEQDGEEVGEKEAIEGDTEELDRVDENNDFKWDELKDEIIGKSDKDFKTLTNSNPVEVNNDPRGNLRIITLDESVSIEEYGLSYGETYIDERQVHFIINLKDKTTTILTKEDQLIYLDIREYVDKEQEDADVLGSGSLLAEYIIYPDGDIEKAD